MQFVRSERPATHAAADGRTPSHPRPASACGEVRPRAAVKSGQPPILRYPQRKLAVFYPRPSRDGLLVGNRVHVYKATGGCEELCMRARTNRFRGIIAM